MIRFITHTPVLAVLLTTEESNTHLCVCVPLQTLLLSATGTRLPLLDGSADADLSRVGSWFNLAGVEFWR